MMPFVSRECQRNTETQRSQSQGEIWFRKEQRGLRLPGGFSSQAWALLANQATWSFTSLTSHTIHYHLSVYPPIIYYLTLLLVHPLIIDLPIISVFYLSSSADLILYNLYLVSIR